MSASYFKAAIPEPHTILGQRLRPFSLGHYLILSRFGSPFVSEGNAVAGRDDLIFAVLVCTMKYDEFFEFIFSEDCDAQVTSWGKNVGPFDINEKVMAFQKYFLEGTQMPKFWEEQSKPASPSGTHWSQAMMVTLTSQVNYTHDQVLNHPFTQVVADYLRHCEVNGTVRMMTDEELAMIAEAKLAAEKEAATCGA
jgi:hypothetical protein